MKAKILQMIYIFSMSIAKVSIYETIFKAV